MAWIRSTAISAIKGSFGPSTLGELLSSRKRDKQSRDEPNAGKVRGRVKGVSAACKKEKHNECFSLTCSCECRHGGYQ